MLKTAIVHHLSPDLQRGRPPAWPDRLLHGLPMMGVPAVAATTIAGSDHGRLSCSSGAGRTGMEELFTYTKGGVNEFENKEVAGRPRSATMPSAVR
jgi:hypothetical protein